MRGLSRGTFWVTVCITDAAGRPFCRWILKVRRSSCKNTDRPYLSTISGYRMCKLTFLLSRNSSERQADARSIYENNDNKTLEENVESLAVGLSSAKRIPICVAVVGIISSSHCAMSNMDIQLNLVCFYQI